MSALVREWMLWQLAAKRSAGTVNERVRIVSQFGDEIGGDPAHAQPLDIIKWLARHSEWSASTAATYHSYLATWFHWLYIMDHRDDNPMIRLPPPPQPDRSPHPVREDLVLLLTAPMHHRTRVMILLAALAGLRVAEIARTRGEDVDIKAPRLYVVSKGGSRGWIPLHPLLVDASLTMPQRGWWFPANSRRPGNHVHSKSVSDIIGQAMQRAGASGTPHSLRHWTGTTLLDEGPDLRAVQELLPHKSLAPRQACTTVLEGRRSDATTRLDSFRGAA